MNFRKILLTSAFLLTPFLAFGADCVDLPNNLTAWGVNNDFSEVTALQNFLREGSYLQAESSGFFGLKTRDAVRAFQTDNGLSASGAVLEMTREKIKNLTCPKPQLQSIRDTVGGSVGYNYGSRGVASAQIFYDVTPPTISSLSPANRATIVSINPDPVYIQFSEPVVQTFATDGSARVVINKLLDNGKSVVFQDSDANDNLKVSLSEDKLRMKIKLSNPLEYGSTYFITTVGVVAKDLAGNDFAGINNDSTWRFTTEVDPASVDTRSPIITSLSPANGATDVSLTINNLQVTFSEPIQKGSGSIYIRDEVGRLIQTIEVSNSSIVINGNKLTIPISSKLNYNTSYYVYIESRAINDLAGNKFVAITNTWKFTTEANDTTPPTITSLSPANGATGVSISASPASNPITIQFSESVRPSLIAGGFSRVKINKITDSGSIVMQSIDANGPQVIFSDNKMRIDLLKDLEYGSTYFITTVGVVARDLAGNNFFGINNDTTWRFTTVPNPIFYSLSDRYRGDKNYFDIDMPVDVNFVKNNSITHKGILKIYFDQRVKKGVGSVAVTNIKDPLDTRTIDIKDTILDDSPRAGDTLYIPRTLFSKPLNYGSKYFITITPGAIEDLAGNKDLGITTQLDNWTIETIPYEKALLLLNYPSPGLLNAAGTYKITWTTINPIKRNLNIELLSVGNNNIPDKKIAKTIFSNVNALDLSKEWEVPRDMPSGRYILEIKSAGGAPFAERAVSEDFYITNRFKNDALALPLKNAIKSAINEINKHEKTINSLQERIRVNIKLRNNTSAQKNINKLNAAIIADRGVINKSINEIAVLSNKIAINYNLINKLALTEPYRLPSYIEYDYRAPFWARCYTSGPLKNRKINPDKTIARPDSDSNCVLGRQCVFVKLNLVKADDFNLPGVYGSNCLGDVELL